jgi:hypothetical protein
MHRHTGEREYTVVNDYHAFIVGKITCAMAPVTFTVIIGSVYALTNISQWWQPFPLNYTNPLYNLIQVSLSKVSSHTSVGAEYMQDIYNSNSFTAPGEIVGLQKQ